MVDEAGALISEGEAGLETGAKTLQEILEHDPLAGTTTGTLDTNLADQQFFNQLKSAPGPGIPQQAPIPQTLTQRVFSVIQSIANTIEHFAGN
jgi:hypothetical protein